MHRREPLRHQLVASLASARYPIRNAHELARVLPAGDLARAGEVRIGREAVMALLFPRGLPRHQRRPTGGPGGHAACLTLEPAPLH